MPLEVKSGISLKAKSLKMFCEKYPIKQAVRASLANMKEEEWLINVPLWAVSMISEIM